MTWIIKMAPPHKCVLPYNIVDPSSLNFGLGSIWQCDDCGLKWKYTGKVEGGWEDHDR